MATKEEISSYFQELNVTINDEVLSKCKYDFFIVNPIINIQLVGFELCNIYNIDAEYFCDQWYAYAASNVGGAAPTIEHLEKLERKEFQKNKDQQSFSTPKRQFNVAEDLYPFNFFSKFSIFQ